MLRNFFPQRAIFFSRLLLYDVIYTTGGVLYLKLKWPLLLIYRMKKNTDSEALVSRCSLEKLAGI
jgi:hypothetical protein